MVITPKHYVPVLRWRMGEYQALLKLDAARKPFVVPLIEVLEPDFDFEKWVPKKNLDDHLSTFSGQLQKKWADRPALLDGRQLPPASRMADGRHPMTFLFDEARALGNTLTPVVALDNDVDYKVAVRDIRTIDQRGVALRCTLDEALDPDFDKNVAGLLAGLSLGLVQVDIILDLRAPTYEPLTGLVGIVQSALSGSASIAAARSVVVLGASFPDTLAHLKLSLETLPRSEWRLYKALVTALAPSARRPAFGDYAVAATTFAKGDMRFMRGAPNVRYAVNDDWIVARRKRNKGETNQAYPGLCALITGSGQYRGKGHSAGGDYIKDCETGAASRGNPTTWKWVATNHHITVVLDGLATLP